MLYLFHGKDTQKSRKKLVETIASFSKKNPHSNIFRLDPDSFDRSLFLEYVGGQSLFSDKLLIVCDGIFKNKDNGEFVLDKIKEVSLSPNVFIFIEEEILKGFLLELEKNSEKVFKFDLLKEEKEKGFNIFSISDAFGEKDKKKLWIVFNKAKREGMVAEEVFWKIVWQLKNMLIAKIAEDKGDRAIEKLKLSPFVLNKSKKYAKNFTEEELKKFYGDLVILYHESRRGNGDFDSLLESFILNLK